MPHPSSVIAYEGPSQLDGEPIVLILTGLDRPTQNPKTGAMVQAFVLPQSTLPTEAVKSGTDASVCGDCPLRRSVCYVNLVPVNSVWRAYKDGRYSHITEETLQRAKTYKRKLRVTAYGDPSAVPFGVWNWLLRYFTHHTGYTHQWRHLHEGWSRFLMASCETPRDVEEATRLGWSTFRVRTPGSKLLPIEVQCPNIKDPSIQCVDCRLCSGTEVKSTSGKVLGQQRETHVSIEVHGLGWKVDNFQKLATVVS